MAHKKRFLAALAIALLVSASLAYLVYFYIGKSNSPEAFWAGREVVSAYDGRNGAAIYFFEKVRRDQPTAMKIKGYADEARKLGETIRLDLALSAPIPFLSTTNDKLRRFMDLQCMIDREVTDEKFRSSQAWAQVSPRLQRYNAARQESLDLVERAFGSNKIVFQSGCP